MIGLLSTFIIVTDDLGNRAEASMKKFKPFLLGSLAGAGLMFGSLNYHVVQSHDGLQIVPRTPQPSLGLAYADIRQWDAQQWSDRSNLARALVAHGASDLISQSVVENVTRSMNDDGGTVDRLRSLLNGSGSDDSAGSHLDAPLFDLFDRDDRSRSEQRSSDDGLAIPFPMESKKPILKDALAHDITGDFLEDTSDRWTSSEQSGGARALPNGFEDRTPRSPAVSQRPSRGSSRDPFDDMDFDDLLMLDTQPAGRSAQEERRREMEDLEESLFGDDSFDSVDGTPGAMDSVRRSLNSRAERVLERARRGLRDEVADASSGMRDATSGYVRNRSGLAMPEYLKPDNNTSPRESSGRAEDGESLYWDNAFDPFLD